MRVSVMANSSCADAPRHLSRLHPAALLWVQSAALVEMHKHITEGSFYPEVTRASYGGRQPDI